MLTAPSTSALRNRWDRVCFGDPTSRITRVRQGLPVEVLNEFGAEVGLGSKDVAVALRLNLEHVNEKKSHDGLLLSPADSDRLYRAITVWLLIVDMLEDRTAAQAWLIRPNRSLGGETPLSLLDTHAGSQLVIDVIGQICYGVVS